MRSFLFDFIFPQIINWVRMMWLESQPIMTAHNSDEKKTRKNSPPRMLNHEGIFRSEISHRFLIICIRSIYCSGLWMQTGVQKGRGREWMMIWWLSSLKNSTNCVYSSFQHVPPCLVITMTTMMMMHATVVGCSNYLNIYGELVVSHASVCIAEKIWSRECHCVCVNAILVLRW